MKVSWLCRGTRDLASTRLHALLIHDVFANLYTGVDSFIWLPQNQLCGEAIWDADLCRYASKLGEGRVLVLQKLPWPGAAALPGLVRQVGGRTIYVQCDLEQSNNLPSLCDVTVVPSMYLKGHCTVSACDRVEFIPDPLEYKFTLRPHAIKEQLVGGWIGHASNWESIEQVRNLLRSSNVDNISVVTISNHADADLVWSERTVLDSIQNFDFGIVPVNKSDYALAKSANRVTLFMSAGIPVIAEDIPSYRSVIDHGVNGLLYSNSHELLSCLKVIQDLNNRDLLSRAGYDFAISKFALDKIARCWHDLVDSEFGKCISGNISNREYKKRVDRFCWETLKRSWQQRDRIADSRATGRIATSLTGNFAMRPAMYKLRDIARGISH